MAILKQNQVRAGVIGHAIGDALGVPVEFKTREYLEENPIKGMIGYGRYNQPAGTWSDDTSMEIALMNALIDCMGIDYRAIMSNYIEWWQDDKFTANDVTFDIGYTTQAALENYLSGSKKPLECGLDDLVSNGNGSLMRSLPVAFLCFKYELDVHDTYNLVRDMSSLTHAHPIAVMGCFIYVNFVRSLLNGGSREDAYYEICHIDYGKFFDEDTIEAYGRILEGNLDQLKKNEINSEGYVVSTLEAALWCLFNTPGYKSAVLMAVNLGGDTDTIGAVTGSMAGIFYGYKEIPSKWIDQLQKVEELIDLADDFAGAPIDMGI